MEEVKKVGGLWGTGTLAGYLSGDGDREWASTKGNQDLVEEHQM